MKEAVLALGTNLLDREKNLRTAIEALKRLPGTFVKKVSSIYETEPFQTPDPQNDYLNCCVKLKTELPPEILLGCCLGIEAAMGRERPFKNAARTIDIDLLLYESATMNTTHLTVPHPRIKERAFVMVPLSDLYEDKVALGFDFNEALDLSNIKELRIVTQQMASTQLRAGIKKLPLRSKVNIKKLH